MTAQTVSPVLQVTGLTVRFGGSTPVKGISFDLKPGERVGLVGESGSGKSLTALSIMRLAKTAKVEGVVALDGVNLLDVPERQMTKVRGGKISMVYQDPMSSLNPMQTIGQQLVEAIRLHEKISVSQARPRALALLEEVGVSYPSERLNQYPHEFSGGMCQRVMIAMAMSARPRVLIADEPTTALDVTTQARIIDLLDRLANDYGTAVILITHDLGVAAGFCERIHVMREGEIVESALANDLYANPQHPYTKKLLGAVVDLTTDVTAPIPAGREGTETITAVRGRSLTPAAGAKRKTLIEVAGISKTYRLGDGRIVSAVDDVSFQITKGETFGLVGESGSGKSTVAKAVLALTSINRGSVTFGDQDLHALSRGELRSARRSMQMVFQDPYSALNRRQTASEIIEAPLVAHRLGTRQSRKEQVREMIHLVGLSDDFAHRKPRTLSGGQCQRVAIARALVLTPDFVVLDESVSALDVSIQAQILNLLRRLQGELGLTYLFISHDLAVIRYMATTVAVMQKGRIVEQASRDDLFTNPQHEYTKTLMAAIPIPDPTQERARRRRASELATQFDDR
jgi:peptide/nickel transport system ATP-binding protein